MPDRTTKLISALLAEICRVTRVDAVGQLNPFANGAAVLGILEIDLICGSPLLFCQLFRHTVLLHFHAF